MRIRFNIEFIIKFKEKSKSSQINKNLAQKIIIFRSNLFLNNTILHQLRHNQQTIKKNKTSVFSISYIYKNVWYCKCMLGLGC